MVGVFFKGIYGHTRVMLMYVARISCRARPKIARKRSRYLLINDIGTQIHSGYGRRTPSPYIAMMYLDPLGSTGSPLRDSHRDVKRRGGQGNEHVLNQTEVAFVCIEPLYGVCTQRL